MYTKVIYIIYERSISYLTILKLFEFSGFQTKTVYKQSFKYLKNEKINLMMKINRMFLLSEYIHIISSYFIFIETF
jgi:hypothetical protein